MSTPRLSFDSPAPVGAPRAVAAADRRWPSSAKVDPPSSLFVGYAAAGRDVRRHRLMLPGLLGVHAVGILALSNLPQVHERTVEVAPVMVSLVSPATPAPAVPPRALTLPRLPAVAAPAAPRLELPPIEVEPP